MSGRLPEPSPLRLRQYLLACFRRDIRVYITRRLWSSNIWPPRYNPELLAIHRITSVLVFCSIWQVPAALAATFLSIVAIAIGQRTLQWRFALVLGCCAWLPCLLIWGIAIEMVRVLARELRSAWVVYDGIYGERVERVERVEV
jgi:hypothetical protein